MEPEIIFDWTITTDDTKLAEQLDNEIIDMFIEGNSGEFIQSVCGGNPLLLGSVTKNQKRAFAIRKLTELNLNSFDQAKIEKQVMTARQEIAEKQGRRELPKLIVHPESKGGAK